MEDLGDANAATPPATSPAEHDLLDFCPFCGYSLTGLPVAHRCPECGQPVDRRWRVFGGRALARHRTGFWHMGRAVLIIPLVYTSAAAIGVLFIPETWMTRGLLFLLLAGSGLIVIGVMLYQPRRFIALAADGVVVYRGRNRLDHYPWAHVGQARYDLLWKSLRFDFRGKPVRVNLQSFFGSEPTEADRCIREINRYPRPPAALDPAETEGQSETRE